MESSQEEQLVQVKFFTKETAYLVTDKPFTVPSSLRRLGLSEVINHLLNHESPVPFEFLIHGEFLRTSLLTFMTEREISFESILEVEYIRAVPPPSTEATISQNDWVSACQSFPDASGYLTGSYDCQVRVWDHSGNLITSLAGHTGPVKSVALLNPSSASLIGSEFRLLSASKDESVRMWSCLVDNNMDSQLGVCRCEFVGHTDSVESIALHPDGTHFVSGSSDKTIKMWSLESALDDDLNLSQQLKSANSMVSKKRKIRKGKSQPTQEGQNADQALPKREAIGTLAGHSQVVTCVRWLGTSGFGASKILSSSWDHSLRVWDISTGVNTNMFYGPKAISCCAVSSSQTLVASGHSDSLVRLWDIREADSKERNVVKMTLASHKSIVSGIEWSPTNANQFASCSFDGKVKLWDIRSTSPVCTLARSHSDKVLSLDWSSPSILLSGGADQTVVIHRMHSHGDC
eukprot:Sdes_comp20976_c1_seq1m19096